MLDFPTISNLLTPVLTDGFKIGIFMFLGTIMINMFNSFAFPKTFKGGL